ncbi:glycoside hydrolase superfamily [Microdochium bolleyi]|uniref:Beta-glucuronidase n=1 Tax=Microdochium bolleyi TaxID=196109 RepID=A0A136IWM4_9PEZI|nr:glycoside hydrolase superfamily [Microdochium bolleyi]
MLRPQANSVRELISLDGIWNFALATSVDLEADPAWTRTLPPTLQIPVPASYNDIFTEREIQLHVGWVFYQRQVTVPRRWGDARIVIRVGAATHSGRVYVNDTFVTEHHGGYMPFDADITELVKPGETFRLTIAVNNELTWETIPPGSVEVAADGTRKQVVRHDFFNYSGLHRSVQLCCVPTNHISDVKVVTDVAGTAGTITYEIETSQAVQGSKIRVTLVDEEGETIAEAEQAKGTLSVESVHLWQPGAAYLYQLRVQLLSASGTITDDEYSVSVGVRTVKVVGNQIHINDKPFYFTGFGKHEDYPVRGKGHDTAFMVHDFQLLKWIGANSFRTSHYPYDEDWLDYADRHGVVVIDETAAVGLNLAIIAGIHGGTHKPTFSPETCNDQTRENHKQALRELIARDKNHPSVVMWMVSNEPSAHEETTRQYFEPLTKLTRELDPTRPIAYANEKQAGPREDKIIDLFDVVCLNRYYGWYLFTGDLAAAEVGLEAELREWEQMYGKPIIMTEYGADTLAGMHTIGDVPWSEDYQTRLLEMTHRVFDRVDSVVGEHVWNFADFQTPTNFIFRVDGNKKGVFTRDRKPKAAARSLRQRWTSMKK